MEGLRVEEEEGGGGRLEIRFGQSFRDSCELDELFWDCKQGRNRHAIIKRKK